jgi:glycerol-3-phosphate dehydrogenase
VRIGGGKYTTYRVMARDVVDAAIGREAARARPSRTETLALIGAPAEAAALETLADRLKPGLVVRGLERRHAERLVARHGTQAPDVLALGERLDLIRPIATGSDHLEAEVAWAAREELALTLADVLARRTRLAQERPDRAESVAPRVTQLLGAELGWDEARRTREIETYLAAAHRDFDVPVAAGEARTAAQPAAVSAEPVAAAEPATAIDPAPGPAA